MSCWGQRSNAFRLTVWSKHGSTAPPGCCCDTVGLNWFTPRSQISGDGVGDVIWEQQLCDDVTTSPTASWIWATELEQLWRRKAPPYSEPGVPNEVAHECIVMSSVYLGCLHRLFNLLFLLLCFRFIYESLTFCSHWSSSFVKLFWHPSCMWDFFIYVS